MDAMLRKTTAKNVWIWVCSLKYELYVGIKQTGTFQHSSFLYGSRVRAAGLLKVKDGQLFSLSPLSGHYRAGTSQFKGFVRHLNEVGCDMSKVSISKSLAMIGAIEKARASRVDAADCRSTAPPRRSASRSPASSSASCT